jgi:SAM domain (Sterile alpha motif)
VLINIIGRKIETEAVRHDHEHNPPAERMHQRARLEAAPSLAEDLLDTPFGLHDDVRHRIVGALRSLGLGKYEAAFRKNEIDGTVLPSLPEEHLKRLGVTALGHRLKLLDVIAGLRS